MTHIATSLLTAAAMFDARAAAKANSANQPDSYDYQLRTKANHILVIYQEN